jgi:rRNA maturation RNase YbeY
MIMAKVNFYFNDVSITLKNRNKLKAYIENMFRKEGHPLKHINYVFVSDEFLLKMNTESLGHDYYTDIITFSYSNRNEPIVGESYISTDRIKENALTFESDLSRELHRVVFHGALHLCGYRDKTRKEKEIMKEAEDRHLLKYLKL